MPPTGSTCGGGRGGGRRIFTRELVTLHSVPSVELGGCGCQMPPQVMAPVAEAHIGGPQSEVDLEVQRGPALQGTDRHGALTATADRPAGTVSMQ